MTTIAAVKVPTKSRPHFEGLEGFRGMASIYVFVAHLVGEYGYTLTGGPIGRSLWIVGLNAVGLFFALSGFLLYLPYVSAGMANTPWPNLGRYTIRRLFRLVPIYWFALTVALLVFPRSVVSHPLDFVGYLKMYFLVSPDFNGLVVAWSLKVELVFYAILPAVAMGIEWLARRIGGRDAARRVAVRLGLTIALAMVSNGWRLVRVLTGDDGGTVQDGLLAYLDFFGVGMALAIVYTWKSQGGTLPRPVRYLANHTWASWLLAAEVLWVVTQFNRRPLYPVLISQSVFQHLLMVVVAGLFFLPEVLRDDSAGESPLLDLLHRRPLTELGRLSFSFDLWHLPILLLVTRVVLTDQSFIAMLVVGAVAATLSLFVAHLSFNGIEMPALGVGRKFSDRFTVGRSPDRPGGANAS